MTRYYLSSEVRFHRDSEGRYRAKHAAAGYNAWRPFVNAFGEIVVVARVDKSATSDDGVLVEGTGVRVHPLPYYSGANRAPIGLLRVMHAVRKIGTQRDVFVGRIPEPISVVTLLHARRIRAKRLVMLVADPDVFAEHFRQPLGGWVARIARLVVRLLVRQANAVTYVSQRHFQTEYPVKAGTPNMGRSNVILDDAWMASMPRELRTSEGLNLVVVGSLEHPAKGVDFLIHVVAELHARQVPATLAIVGSGRLQPQLAELAAGVDVLVRFHGQLHDREQLKAVLDDANVFVSGSRSEGLPRASIEAMARALPVVTTDAGAAAEIVDPPFLVKIDDVSSFATALEMLVQDPAVYRAQSALALERAIEIRESADPVRFTRFLRESFVDSDGASDA